MLSDTSPRRGPDNTSQEIVSNESIDSSGFHSWKLPKLELLPPPHIVDELDEIDGVDDMDEKALRDALAKRFESTIAQMAPRSPRINVDE